MQQEILYYARACAIVLLYASTRETTTALQQVNPQTFFCNAQHTNHKMAEPEVNEQELIKQIDERQKSVFDLVNKYGRRWKIY